MQYLKTCSKNLNSMINLKKLITEVNGIKLPEDYLGFMSKPTVSGGPDPAWGGFENTEYLSIVLNG